MARTNAVALPVGFVPSNMAEVCLALLSAMFTTPAPGLLRIYVTIKQLVALCLQTPFKSFVAGLSERSRATGAFSINQEAIA